MHFDYHAIFSFFITSPFLFNFMSHDRTKVPLPLSRSGVDKLGRRVRVARAGINAVWRGSTMMTLDKVERGVMALAAGGGDGCV